MSESTQEKKTKTSNRRRAALGPPRSYDAAWIVGSIALHLLAALVLWFTPVREMIMAPRDPEEFEVTARAERIEEMVEYLRTRESDEIIEQLEEMLDIEEELHDILDDERQRFDEVADTIAADAPTTALEAQARALKAQDEAMQAQSKVLTALGDDARTAQDRARDAQGRAGEAQRIADQAMAFTGEHFKTAKDAQKLADDAQKKASKAQGQISEMQQSAPYIYKAAQRSTERAAQARQKIPLARNDVAEARNHAAKAAKAAEKAHAAQQSAKIAANASRAEANSAKRASEIAKRKARRSKTDNDREKASAAETAEKNTAQKAAADKLAADKAKRSADQLERANRTAKSKLTTAQNRLKDAERRYAEAAGRAEADGRRHRETHARVISVQSGAKKLQIEARKAQAKAKELMETAVKSAANAGEKDLARISTDTGSQAPVRPSLFGKNIAQLYDQAVQTEGRIAETFRNVHATGVAANRGVPIADALSETVVARTERPKLDKKLLTGEVRTARGAAANRAEISKATVQVNAMVEASRSLLDRAARQTGGGGMAMSVAEGRAVRNLAREDENQRYKDLSGAMKSSSQASASPTHGSGETGRPGKKGYYTRHAQPLAGRSPRDVVPGRVVVTRGARPTVFVADRKSKTSRWVQARWMYVDSWYTIGPFPNPGRKNIDTQFPPESVIDLNAVYAGKDGRKLKWEFINGSAPMLIPAGDEPYGIYYACTDLWFEEAMDLLIAVGSDDNSRLWIEGKPVWISGRKLKAWRADEGYRTVHFKKGLNRVLYRIENGWRVTAFSLLICLERPR